MSGNTPSNSDVFITDSNSGGFFNKNTDVSMASTNGSSSMGSSMSCDQMPGANGSTGVRRRATKDDVDSGAGMEQKADEQLSLTWSCSICDHESNPSDAKVCQNCTVKRKDSNTSTYKDSELANAVQMQSEGKAIYTNTPDGGTSNGPRRRVDDEKISPTVDPPTESEAPPGVLGYQVGHYLGEGAYGSVYLGKKHPKWDRPKAPLYVALKTVRLKSMSQQQTQHELKQIKQEVSTQPKIQHINVCKQLGFDRTMFVDPKTPNASPEPVFCFVLELCPNGTLFDHVEGSTRWGEKLACSYFHQLIDGLDACHKQGIAHRDLKPENVLLDNDFVLKICDFGMARSFSGDKAMFTAAGTRAYRAPETFSKRKGGGGRSATGYDKACDVWSAGVVCFIMIAGFPPLKLAQGTDWWFDKLRNKRIPLFWQAHEQTARFGSAICKDFIIRILDPNPETRLSIDDIRKHEWYNQDIFTPAECAKLLKRRKRAEEQAQQERSLARQGVRRNVRGGPGPEKVVLEKLVNEVRGQWPKGIKESNDLSKIFPKLDAIPSKFRSPTRTGFLSEESPRDIMTCIVEVLKKIAPDCKVTLDCNHFNLDVEMSLKVGADKQTDDGPGLDFKGLPSMAPQTAKKQHKFQVEVRDKGRAVYQVAFRRTLGCPLDHAKFYTNVVEGIDANENFPKLVFIN